MSSPPHSHRRFPLWLILSGLGLLLLMVALIPVVLFFIWSGNQARRVEELLAHARQRGEPVTAEELAEAFPLEAGQEDVTKLWREGMEKLISLENRSAAKGLPFVGVGSDETPLPKLDAPWDKLAEAEKYLSERQAALDLLHAAAERGGRGRFAEDYAQGYGMLLPPVQSIREAARILMLELEVKARQGDARGAAQALRSLLILPRCLEREPTIISDILRTAFESAGVSSLAQKLCLVPFTERELIEFQQILEARDPQKCLRIALLSERAVNHAIMRNPALFDGERKKLSPFQADQAMQLEVMTRYIEAIEQDFPGCFAAIASIDADLKERQSQPFSSVVNQYSSEMLPDMSSMVESAARNIAFNRAAAIGVAIQRYRREKGTTPGSIMQLVPEYLASSSIDPFDGQSMRLIVDETGFTVYSVGRNRVDDRGSVTKSQKDDGFRFPIK